MVQIHIIKSISVFYFYLNCMRLWSHPCPNSIYNVGIGMEKKFHCIMAHQCPFICVASGDQYIAQLAIPKAQKSCE